MIEKIIAEIKKQAEHHPDPSMREFYMAFLKRHENSDETKQYLKTLCNAREDLSSKHLTNLVYRSTQHILIYEYNKKDMGFYKKLQWESVLNDIFESKKLTRLHKDKILNENTQTNIYQRYAGPAALIASKHNGKPLNIVDLGCSQNLGLMGLELNFPFLTIEDTTKNNKFTKLLEQPFKINNALGIDLEDPIEKREWALTCRFYPQEMGSFDDEERMIRYFNNRTKKTKFLKGNILSIDKIWGEKKLPKADIVIASLIFYQFSPELREKAIEKIHKILKQGGLLIINDFVKVNSHVNWEVVWFENGKSNYKTFAYIKEHKGFTDPLEFVIWDNARCRKVEEGRDFNKLLKL